ncbi:MAG: M48 family metallopeptidase [Leptolyngbya sp.]|nr:M48 family metallopeptidase [Leptolyngbya sp.]
MQLWERMRRTSRRWMYGAIALVMAVSLVAVTPQKSQAGIFDLIFNGIQYIQLSNLNDAQEYDLGRRTDQALKQQGVRVYNRDPEIVAYVNRIGQSLAATSERPPNDNFQYTFQIVDDDAVNAFATSGGFVYINRGLMLEADNEAELAGVMAHEIGHIVGRHSINRMRELALARGIAGGLGVNQDALVGLGVELALFLPNSRSAEYEADTLGFHNMGRAGYDQRGFITFMQKLGEGGSPPEFLSTHPNPDNRVGNLQAMYNDSAVPTATAGTNTNVYRSNISGL